MSIKQQIEYIVLRASELMIEGYITILECIYIAEYEIKQIEHDMEVCI